MSRRTIGRCSPLRILRCHKDKQSVKRHLSNKYSCLPQPLKLCAQPPLAQQILGVLRSLTFLVWAPKLSHCRLPCNMYNSPIPACLCRTQRSLPLKTYVCRLSLYKMRQVRTMQCNNMSNSHWRSHPQPKQTNKSDDLRLKIQAHLSLKDNVCEKVYGNLHLSLL